MTVAEIVTAAFVYTLIGIWVSAAILMLVIFVEQKFSILTVTHLHKWYLLRRYNRILRDYPYTANVGTNNATVCSIYNWILEHSATSDIFCESFNDTIRKLMNSSIYRYDELFSGNLRFSLESDAVLFKLTYNYVPVETR
jgi:hypothetical protein